MTQRLPVAVLVAALLRPLPARAQVVSVGATALHSAPTVLMPSSLVGPAPASLSVPSIQASGVSPAFFAAAAPVPALSPSAVPAAGPTEIPAAAAPAAAVAAKALAPSAAAFAPEFSGAMFDGSRFAPFRDQDPIPNLTPRQQVVQRFARFKLLAQRAAVLPSHLWPFTALARKISHGEALAGLSPSSAVSTARAIRSAHATGTVVGRLSWELHDVWSVRGAVDSYGRLIDSIASAKAEEPGLDVAVSLDVEALGAQLDGFSEAERLRVARANALRLARRAKAAGVPVEFDIGSSALLPLLLDVARSAARELDMPVRVALAARYLASGPALRAWAELARETGLRLGVRLVKGSFIEGDRTGTVNRRGPLIAEYKKLVTAALSQGAALDVAVATQNPEIWEHARAEAARLDADFSVHAIRGVNAPLQERMRAAGEVAREYVSYGVDTPVMALMEMWTNWRQRRALAARGVDGID